MHGRDSYNAKPEGMSARGENILSRFQFGIRFVRTQWRSIVVTLKMWTDSELDLWESNPVLYAYPLVELSELRRRQG